ncbi:hypothetical protein HDU76_010459 [Blyttiomyces sp. JEL0837]|nr:hypothetical protein HDU76_010459 [Blyttiomyces sp. JEL0837]
MFPLTTIISLITASAIVITATPIPGGHSTDGFLHANSGNYTQCPKYTDIYDSVAMHGFEQESYQGNWYSIADTEKSEPYFCACDKFTWTINKNDPKHYTEALEGYCSIQSTKFPLNLGLSGETYTNAFLQGSRTEGSPPLAAWIPNQVLYIESNPNWQTNNSIYRYQYAIVFSCKENYLFQPVFTSLQIFARTKDVADGEIQRLVSKAKTLVNFDVKALRYPQDSAHGCVYPNTTKLECPAGCPAEKCVGGMVGVKGVPVPRCLA